MNSEPTLCVLSDSPRSRGLALLPVVVECVVAAKANDEVGKTTCLNTRRGSLQLVRIGRFLVHARQTCSIMKACQTRSSMGRCK